MPTWLPWHHSRLSVFNQTLAKVSGRVFCWHEAPAQAMLSIAISAVRKPCIDHDGSECTSTTVPCNVGPGPFFPQLPSRLARLAKMIYTTSFCQHQPRTRPSSSPLAGSVPRPSSKKWQAGKKRITRCIILSRVDLLLEAVSLNMHVQSEIPQSRIGDPSSPSPTPPQSWQGQGTRQQYDVPAGAVSQLDA